MIFHVCSYHTDVTCSLGPSQLRTSRRPAGSQMVPASLEWQRCYTMRNHAKSCEIMRNHAKSCEIMRNHAYLSWQTLKHHRRFWLTRAKCLAQMRAPTLPYLTSKCCVQHYMLDFRSAILKQCPTNDWSSAAKSGPKLLLIESAYLVWMLHDLRSKSLRPCCPRVALAQESCWAKGCRGSSATPLSVSVQDHKYLIHCSY